MRLSRAGSMKSCACAFADLAMDSKCAEDTASCDEFDGCACEGGCPEPEATAESPEGGGADCCAVCCVSGCGCDNRATGVGAGAEVC